MIFVAPAVREYSRSFCVGRAMSWSGESVSRVGEELKKNQIRTK